MTSPHIYLASSSPRRGQLLEQLGIRYRRVAAPVIEQLHAGETPEAYVRRLALAKARAGWQALPLGDSVPVLGADTCISLDGEIFGKPRDRTDGVAMLEKLARRRHEVWSAVALVQGGREEVRVQCSRVTFGPLTQAQCEHYWASGEAWDKAGGYAIQGKAAAFIRRIDGSYSGVMGLPLYETAELLKAYNIPVPG
jgi:septum formation protein